MNLADANILYEAFQKAIKTAKWKSVCQRADHESLEIISGLQKDLANGTYKTQPLSNFVISERGKTRVINGNTIRDRVVRHALCDNVLMPLIQRKVIYDNSASQVGKGVDFARKRFKTHLQKYYRQYGNDGYVLMIDFSRYYDNIIHDIAIEQLSNLMDDVDNIKLLEEIFDSFKIDVSFLDDNEYKDIYRQKFNNIDYQKISKSKKTGEKFMRKSVPIGDQTSQIVGIFYPYQIDNYCKIVKGIKYYGRYMDDIYIIHNDKQYLKSILIEIREMASELGIHINERKTQIYKLDRDFHFLQNMYRLTNSGRVVERISKKRLVKMRQKLKKLARMVNNGERQLKDIQNMYLSWIGAYKKIMSKKQINNFEQLYNELFGKDNNG